MPAEDPAPVVASPALAETSARSAREHLTPQTFAKLHTLIRPHDNEWRHLRVEWLTDVIAVLARMGHRVGCVQAPADETQGVNDRWQLALAERELRSRTNRRWLLNGVTMLDPRQTFIDVTVDLGRDVTLYPGTMLQGTTVVGNGCEIGPNTRLVDCKLGERATVQYSVGTSATIGAAARVGPFAVLPPGTVVGADEDTGPFYTAQE